MDLTNDFLISTRLRKELSELKIKIVDVNSEIRKNELLIKRYREILSEEFERQDECELMEKKIWKWIELMWRPLKRSRNSTISSVSSITISRPPGITTRPSIKSESIVKSESIAKSESISIAKSESTQPGTRPPKFVM